MISIDMQVLNIYNQNQVMNGRLSWRSALSETLWVVKTMMRPSPCCFPVQRDKTEVMAVSITWVVPRFRSSHIFGGGLFLFHKS